MPASRFVGSFRPVRGTFPTILLRIADREEPLYGSKELQMGGLPAGRHFFRGDDGYEPARRGTVWNRRVPERYPDLIVQAVDADDVVAAIGYAKAGGHRVSIRSGGHSWAANHLRDGAVLLDVSGLDHATVDADRGIAVVGPGKGGSVLAADLDASGLFFPAGHCKGVCVGGYLLQGGYGWNSRVLGPACESVIGLDVVTAFHLKLHPRPAVCASSLYAYPIDLADDIYTWAREVSAEVDRRVELQIVASRSVPGADLDGPAIVFASPAFADTEEEAEKALALLGACPVVDKAIIKVPYAQTDLPTWYTAVMSNYLADHRYAADNMWTSAPADDLLP